MSDQEQKPASVFNQDDYPEQNEDLSTGLKVVSFCVPLVGIILYFVEKDKNPVKSKSACNMALIGIGVGIVLQILVYALGLSKVGG